MQKGKFNIVIGAQAGSEAKGKLAAWVATNGDVNPDAIFMTSSPNAGHTLWIGDAKYVSYHLPVSCITTECPVLLGPASVINLNNLAKEVNALGIDPSRIHIHPRASLITSDHLATEMDIGLSGLGSTLQGVGAARVTKMMRGHAGKVALAEESAGFLQNLGFMLVDTTVELSAMRMNGLTVLCEMTQGFDLDLEHGIHPTYCTSKMVNPAMAMAEAGVPPSWVGDVYGVFRPYPIRVNNRTGSSGPYYGATEISWAQVAKKCEYTGPMEDFAEITTTTKLPRRVFTWSSYRFDHFMRVCAPTVLCLQFANYIDWSNHEETDYSLLTAKTHRFVHDIEQNYGVPVRYIGTGKKHEHMIDRGELEVSR